ncbi:MAG TPA: hypothetical protein VGD95_06885 [Micavibrio sp.]
MDTIVIYIIYILVKFLAYAAWSYLGLKILAGFSAPSKRQALSFGFLRLLMGGMFGVLIFLMYPTGPEALVVKYIGIYGAVRLVEWGLLGLLIYSVSDRPRPYSRAFLYWVIGGILVSFAVDLLSPAGIDGHFCVGRCLG